MIQYSIDKAINSRIKLERLAMQNLTKNYEIKENLK